MVPDEAPALKKKGSYILPRPHLCKGAVNHGIQVDGKRFLFCSYVFIVNDIHTICHLYIPLPESIVIIRQRRVNVRFCKEINEKFMMAFHRHDQLIPYTFGGSKFSGRSSPSSRTTSKMHTGICRLSGSSVEGFSRDQRFDM